MASQEIKAAGAVPGRNPLMAAPLAANVGAAQKAEMAQPHHASRPEREPVAAPGSALVPSGFKFRAVFHEEEDGGFWAEVPGFPGCASEGDTLEEARANIREAFL